MDEDWFYKHICSMLRSSYLNSYFHKTLSNDKKRNTPQRYKTESFLRLFFRINYHEATQQIAKLQEDIMYVSVVQIFSNNNTSKFLKLLKQTNSKEGEASSMDLLRTFFFFFFFKE